MSLINKKRREEVNVLRKMSFFGVAFMFIWNVTPFLVNLKIFFNQIKLIFLIILSLQN